MISEYLIDPYLIGVLYQQEDPEKILEIYRDLLDKVGRTYDLTLKNYLLANNIPAVEVEKVLSGATDSLPSNIQQLLENSILKDSLQVNIQALLKAYYDVLLPKLDQAKQQEVVAYINENISMLKEQQTVFLKGVSALSGILESAGANDYAQLEKKEELQTTVEKYLGNSKIEEERLEPSSSASVVTMNSQKERALNDLIDNYLKSLQK